MSLRGKAKKSFLHHIFLLKKKTSKKLKLKSVMLSPSSSSSVSPPPMVHFDSVFNLHINVKSYRKLWWLPFVISGQDPIEGKWDTVDLQPASGDESDPIGKKWFLSLRQLSMVVGEVINGVMTESDSRLHWVASLQAQQQPAVERFYRTRERW